MQKISLDQSSFEEHLDCLLQFDMYQTDFHVSYNNNSSKVNCCPRKVSTLGTESKLN